MGRVKKKKKKTPTLRRLDGVHPRGPLLGPDDLVCGGEVHVARAGDGHPALGQLVGAAVLGQQRLQLVHGHLEATRGKDNQFREFFFIKKNLKKSISQ